MMRIAVVAGVTLLTFALALGVWSLWDAHRQTRQEADRALQNLVQALGQDIARNIELYDVALRDVVAGVGLSGLSNVSPEIRQAALFSSIDHARYMTSLLALNQNGDIIFDSGHSSPRTANFGDRDYFQVQRERPDVGLYASRPFLSRLGGERSMAFSRRISRPDGSFAGIAVGGLELNYFRDVFSRLNLGALGSVTLLREDGLVLARWPWNDAAIGRDLRDSPIFQASRISRFGVGEGTALIDGVKRLFAFQRVDELHMIISVGLAKKEVFAAWRNKAIETTVELCVVVSLAALLAWALRRELRRRALLEARLRESEAQFRLLAENANDMVSRVGPNGARKYISPAAPRIFGDSLTCLRSIDLMDRVVVEDLPAVTASVRRLLTGASESETSVFRIQNTDRGEVWVQSSAQVVRDPVTGALDGYVSILRDMTERRAAEDALKTSEARFRLLAETTGDAITCLNLKFKCTYVSPAYKILFGYEPDEVVGDAPATTMHPEDADDVYQRVRPLVKGETEQTSVTFRVRHKLEYWVWTEASLSLARDEITGQPAMIVCALRDISKRKTQADELQTANTELERLARHLARAKESAERASAAKSRFLAGMSHELRTPLNGILGYAQLLRLDGGLNATQSTRVDSMLSAGTHLLQMINSVLDLSEIEAEHVLLQAIEVELEYIANCCLDLVRPAALQKGLGLSLTISSEAPRCIITDPTRLRQLLLNLLGNAVKFTSHGSVELRLTGVVEERIVRIEVADTGPGIPADRHSELFQDFERLGAAAQTVEGAGLGLALSARLTGVMGGRIGYEDNQAGGSVFWLELPEQPAFSVSNEAEEERSMTNGHEPPARSDSCRVLVVDDMAMNRDIAASFLRAAGLEVICADDGAAAIEAAAGSDFDIILMDVRMPLMDGLEATRRIRTLPGWRGQVPIVALTAQAFADQVTACKLAGMVDHISKPFTQSALLTVIERTLAKSQTNAGGATPGGLRSSSDSQKVTAAAPQEESQDTKLIGSELPVFDRIAFESTAAFLTSETVYIYLHTLARSAETLRGALQEQDAMRNAGPNLADDAHALAGAAGMLGFDRLSVVARKFEHAVQTGSDETLHLTTALTAAIDATLLETTQPIRFLAGCPEVVG